MQILSYAAAILLVIAAWVAFPQTWTAVAWGVVALGLALAGRRFELPELGYQASFVGLASVFRVLAINLTTEDKFHGMTLRLVTVIVVCGLLYLTSNWVGDSDRTRGIEIAGRLFSSGEFSSAAFTWAASGLLGLLAWYELRPVSVCDAWLVGALLLLELGLSRKKLSLRLQAYAALAAGFARIHFVNLNAAGNPGEVSSRFYTVVPLALGFFYSYWRLGQTSDSLFPSERKSRIADAFCWMGTITSQP